MSLNSIYELYQTMERDHAMVSFKGEVTADLLNSVLQIMESKLGILEKSTRTRKKVYNVLVECLQNLYHHNDGIGSFREQSFSDIYLPKTSILIISNPDDYYEVKTGNFVSLTKVKQLEEKIENINNLNRLQLRELYKSILFKGEMSQKGTAGLGLIDIARKSGNKLEYSFLPIDENFSFFCLNVKIN
ncbi:SiaB family protein kinase [Brumimicrobium mesophilum]|uniref:SiaB family protein kinase n=1 Tax=Brumimicrobium mesophilum TaxID=392717 RepID=UPI000D140F62|nr:SiaB family protein kinase [Brumimicrobium mesophilum]